MSTTPNKTGIASHRTRLLRIAFGLVLACIIVALVLQRASPFPKRLAVVEPGVLYRCSQPTVPQLENIRKEHGIKTLFVVREADGKKVQAEIAWANAQPGIKLVHAPIDGSDRIPQECVDRFFQTLDDPANHPVLIHCSAGRHRTGYLCALYRIERQGWSVQQAIDEMMSFKFSKKGHSAIYNQLRAYKPSRERHPEAGSVDSN